jgi:hypothetical protein
MDSIDITDAAFALDTPTIDSIIDTNTTDYSMFLSIGLSILACIIGFFAYRFYQNKNGHQQQKDCPGGFCTMENRTTESQQSSRTL